MKKNNPGLDAHWGIEKTYDYYLNKHGRNSFDNAHGLIKSYVYYDININNAFWNGTINLGDGGGKEDGPKTSINTLAHEFTHGVSQNNGSGGLNYQNESGAISESFSDIFATAVEFYAKPATANWLHGDESSLIGSCVRSLENPKLKQQPNTYQGQYWANPLNLNDGDAGGVHTNSGIMNYWFYLLSQGGSGVNDPPWSNSYSVAGIGITKAEEIAYRTLTNFSLPINATFYDAMQGSLNAAEYIYGAGSVEYWQVKAAWYAVGVGDDPSNYCSGTTKLTASSGTFSDGSGSANYGNNTNCRWVITPAGTTQISLNFTAFDTESIYDSVIVYNGPDIKSPKLMTWWGSTLPPTINSTGGALCVRFSSDNTTTAGGWIANYTSTGITPTCNGLTILSTPTGTFNDGSGVGNYGNNQQCAWYIAPPCATTVTLSFSAFNTESGYDGILIYDDYSGTNKLAELTGTSIPTPVTSTTGQMLVVFVSDYSTTMQGFTANYTSTGSGFCSGTTLLNTSDFGSITDGSGTNNYCNNLDCRWLIQPPQATSVTLNFTAFDLEVPSSDGKSIYDGIEIYDGTTTGSPLLGRFSGSNIPPSITSSGGSMLIRFYSDFENARQGWAGYYTSTNTTYCSGTTTLSAISGTFSDGSGENKYANNSECSWLIQPTNASSITLSFSEFNTELNYDGVIVYDGPNNTSPVLGQFTGTSLPSTTTSTGGSMFVEFLSDPILRANGWTANYTSSVTTGLDDSDLNENLKIFPNPTSGVFTIESCFENTVTVQIMDMLGKQVLKSYSLYKGANQVNASDLSKGIYLIKLKFDSGSHIEKLIIK
ncbi:MAG: M4 family metallopeptidase [Bacteroidia bacterium]|nr:M4 family metallopeptidase [Bacteroidia bacterium]